MCIRDSLPSLKDGEINSRNPCLTIAKLFDILPNQLPGIVAFALDDASEKTLNAAYWPLDIHVFDPDANDLAQNVIADFYSYVETTMQLNCSPSEKVDFLKKQISSEMTLQKSKPFIAALKRSTEFVLKLPEKIIPELLAAWAKGA